MNWAERNCCCAHSTRRNHPRRHTAGHVSKFTLPSRRCGLTHFCLLAYPRGVSVASSTLLCVVKKIPTPRDPLVLAFSLCPRSWSRSQLASPGQAGPMDYTSSPLALCMVHTYAVFLPKNPSYNPASPCHAMPCNAVDHCHARAITRPVPRIHSRSMRLYIPRWTILRSLDASCGL